MAANEGPSYVPLHEVDVKQIKLAEPKTTSGRTTIGIRYNDKPFHVALPVLKTSGIRVKVFQNDDGNTNETMQMTANIDADTVKLIDKIHAQIVKLLTPYTDAKSGIKGLSGAVVSRDDFLPKPYFEGSNDKVFLSLNVDRKRSAFFVPIKKKPTQTKFEALIDNDDRRLTLEMRILYDFSYVFVRQNKRVLKTYLYQGLIRNITKHVNTCMLDLEDADVEEADELQATLKHLERTAEKRPGNVIRATTLKQLMESDDEE